MQYGTNAVQTDAGRILDTELQDEVQSSYMSVCPLTPAQQCLPHLSLIKCCKGQNMPDGDERSLKGSVAEHQKGINLASPNMENLIFAHWRLLSKKHR